MLHNKKVVILTAHEFEDIEVMYTLLRLSEEGAEVTVATLPLDSYGHFCTRPYWSDKPITGRFGSTIPFYVLAEGRHWKHISTNDLNVDHYDAVAITGGFAPDYLRCDDKVLSFVADMYKAKKIVAAICHGPWLFASTDCNKGTDIVKGRKVTSWLAVRDDLKNAGGEWSDDQPVIREGNVITSRCPDDLPDFCREIVKALS